jgi:hypothetical protein
MKQQEVVARESATWPDSHATQPSHAGRSSSSWKPAQGWKSRKPAWMPSWMWRAWIRRFRSAAYALIALPGLHGTQALSDGVSIHDAHLHTTARVSVSVPHLVPSVALLGLHLSISQAHIAGTSTHRTTEDAGPDLHCSHASILHEARTAAHLPLLTTAHLLVSSETDGHAATTLLA